jgi:hypothetical protein
VKKIHIDRLDVRVQGLDAAVVRAAFDRLPARLAAALRDTPRAVAADGDIRVASGADAPALAAALAQRIAAAVRRGAAPPAPSGGGALRAGRGEE